MFSIRMFVKRGLSSAVIVLAACGGTGPDESPAGPANQAPTASIGAPGAATQGSTVQLSATATDGDGTVVKVEFFDGTTKLGEDLTSPYALTWTPATAGTRDLTARATDDQGATTTSPPLTVTVTAAPGNQAPSVTLNAPASGTPGVALQLTASASDADGSVARVEYFAGATKIGEDTTAPYTLSWTPAAGGVFNLTARATDNQGATGTSAAVVATINTAPVATIVAPAAGLTFRAGDDIGFSGRATDAEDGTLPGTSLTWWAELHHDTHTHPFLADTPGASGSVSIPVRGETADNIFYRFHLRATDRNGATHEVTRDVLPEKSRITLATVPPGLALTLDGQPVSSYPFNVTGVEGIERDLGAADQNLNGRRYRFASWSDGGAASHTISTPVNDTTYTATFTDIGPVNNQLPTVTLNAAATGTTGTPMQLTATAADSDGTIARVEFFEGATRLGEDTTAPYAYTWTPATTGARSLTARATDDQGATTTSSAVVVTVSAPQGPDTTAPTVSITAPAAFAAALTGTVSFTVNASDNVGVANVEFQLDGVALGAPDTSAPYATSVDTAQYTLGQHVLRARARDAANNVSAWTAITVNFSGGATQPAGFTRNVDWITGLSSATAFAEAPDGRLFVAQQGGALRVVKNGVLLGTPFVTLPVDAQGERGLIGVTLDPAFATNGFVYVYHTVTAGGVHNRISRLTASGDVAVPGSETALVDLPALSGATNHNGGAMHFGVDQKLYVAVGENASPSRAQDPNDPFGKMLRFNADGTIPSDNPFFAQRTGLARAIWASGLRNPFTFAVQPVTGRIHINDVGQGTWEEVNLGVPMANYGWPGSEGPDNVTGGITAPLFAYRHSATAPPGTGPGGFFTGFAIAGGAFYPDSGPFPADYRGQYFFADFVSRYVGRIDLANGNAAYAFARLSGDPVDMLVGTDGALYVLTRGGITRISAP